MVFVGTPGAMVLVQNVKRLLLPTEFCGYAHSVIGRARPSQAAVDCAAAVLKSRWLVLRLKEVCAHYCCDCI